jgi:hypothetical protein
LSEPRNASTAPPEEPPDGRAGACEADRADAGNVMKSPHAASRTDCERTIPRRTATTTRHSGLGSSALHNIMIDEIGKTKLINGKQIFRLSPIPEAVPRAVRSLGG